MSSHPISNMTRDELSQLIEEMIDRRFQALFKPSDRRSTSELLAELDRLRFTPPDGSKSSLEMLREDRDS